MIEIRPVAARRPGLIALAAGLFALALGLWIWVAPLLGLMLGLAAFFLASAAITGSLPSSVRIHGSQLVIRPRLMPRYRRDATTLLTVEIHARQRATHEFLTELLDRLLFSRDSDALGPSDVIVFNFEDYADNVTLRGLGYRRTDVRSIARAAQRDLLDGDEQP